MEQRQHAGGRHGRHPCKGASWPKTRRTGTLARPGRRRARVPVLRQTRRFTGVCTFTGVGTAGQAWAVMQRSPAFAPTGVSTSESERTAPLSSLSRRNAKRERPTRMRWVAAARPGRPGRTGRSVAGRRGSPPLSGPPGIHRSPLPRRSAARILLGDTSGSLGHSRGAAATDRPQRAVSCGVPGTCRG